MTEVTRIVTVEITGIVRSGNILPKEKTAALLKECILAECGADDVVVTKIQDFEMEVVGGKD